MSIISNLLAKKETSQYFLLLALEAHRIRAAICQILGNQVSIKGSGESEFIEGENETEAADIAISMAEKKLPNQILVEKVIFALPQTFLENDKIKPEYLDRLKIITKELSLTPCGFIEYPTALSFHLEKEEGAPPTLLLLHIDKQQLIFSLLRIGKIQQNIVIPRSSSLSSDFEASLSQFATEILPSRIILYDEGKSEQLEELKEELLRFPWNRYSIFLHTPKIEILPEEKILLALVDAAASSLLKTLTPLHHAESVSQPDIILDEAEKKEEDKTSKETFGFVKTKEETTKKQKEIAEEIANVKETHLREENTPFTAKKASLKLPKLSFLPHHISLPPFSKTIFLLVISLCLPILILILLFWSIPKALIYLIIYPQTVTSKMNITFATAEGKLVPEKNIILATPLTDEITGNKTVITSGKTKIGEKAKGEVTIYNKNTSSKTFPKGTVLLTPDLKFTLDNDVTVASASDTGEGLTFGKTTVKISASEIGPEGNIESNHNFTFKDFPPTSYTAKNAKEFAGGTSREVSSVSAEDQNELEKSLTNELTAKVKQQSFTKLPPGEKLINTLVTSTVVSKKFSSSIGSEAKELTLSLIVKINAFSYKEADLIAQAQKSLPSAPVGFTIDTQKTNIIINDAQIDKNGNINAVLSVTASFLPEVEKEKIKPNIIGKTYREAASFLSTVQYIGGVKIIKEGDLPFLGNRLPFSSQNITLQLITY